jgi:hypothetical protein
MKHELRTEIDIDAPPSDVWGALTDFPAYASWNPFIVMAQGSADVGRRLTLLMRPPGRDPMTMRPRVTASTGHVLEWLGHFRVRGLFDGRHRFELVPTDTGTHLTQSESFSGLLVRSLRKALDRDTRAGFEAMNAALRDRVQRSRPSAQGGSPPPTPRHGADSESPRGAADRS